MKKAARVLIPALVIFALAGCSLFFDAKIVSYSVSHSVSSVSVVIAYTGEEGIFFEESAQTNWDYEFEVKYTDFPFLAHIVVTNNSGQTVTMAVYLEDTEIDSKPVISGTTEVITTTVAY